MNIEQIELKDIFFDLENPRHEPYQTEEEVIDYLCKYEYVLALAKDIVKIGMNPLEIMAIIPSTASDNTFVIAEGNRRLCAIKLLNDPELAPSDLRKEFKSLSEHWQVIKTLPTIKFESRDTVRDWLERIHGGLQGGIGRKDWSTDQKTRFTGNTKNLMSIQLLDYAQKLNLINKQERTNKTSTVQRFISNPLLRDAFGLDISKNDEIQRIRPEADFNLILNKFIGDLITGEINTRYNAPEIKTYSNELRNIPGLTQEIVSPESLIPIAGSGTTTNPNSKAPTKPRYLSNQEATGTLLTTMSNYKLSSIYHSLHKLQVKEHCPLLTVGLWSFLESLTALAGRNPNDDFYSFLSVARLKNFGLGDKNSTKAMRECVKRVSENGNTTKHDGVSASFSDQQLINDFEVLHPLIQALVSEAIRLKK